MCGTGLAEGAGTQAAPNRISALKRGLGYTLEVWAVDFLRLIWVRPRVRPEGMDRSVVPGTLLEAILLKHGKKEPK
jgi:hypothetical protein